MLLDSNPLQPWELWFAGSALAVLGWVVTRLVGKWDGTRKVVRKTVLRVDRHETDIVAGLRGGHEYGPLPEDPDD